MVEEARSDAHAREESQQVETPNIVTDDRDESLGLEGTEDITRDETDGDIQQNESEGPSEEETGNEGQSGNTDQTLPRRSTRQSVPPKRFGAYCKAEQADHDPESGWITLGPGKISSDQRKLQRIVEAASITVGHVNAAEVNAITTGEPSEVQRWIRSIPENGKINCLDICSASKSILRAMENAGVADRFNVVSVDSDQKWSPDICMTAQQLAKELANGNVPEELAGIKWHIIWASPPCTWYSQANTMRDEATANEQMEAADEIVEACLSIIDHLKPTCWFIENPDTGSRRLRDRPIMKKYAHLANSVTYCRYGRQDRKATMIISNLTDLQLHDCRKGDECLAKRLLGRHTRTAQSGPTKAADGSLVPGTPTEESQQVPDALIQHLFTTALERFGKEFSQGHFEVAEGAKEQLLKVAFARVHAIIDTDERRLGERVRTLKEVPPREILEAKNKEIGGLLAKGAFTVVPRSAVPKDASVMGFVWVLKVRDDDTVKARLCVGGHRQTKGQNFWETSSPTPRASSVKLALSHASIRGHNIYTADVSQAYVAAPIGAKLYMKMPPEMQRNHPDSVLELKMSLYGAKQSGRNWYQEASRILTEQLNYHQLEKDPCVFKKVGDDGKPTEIILMYVDDFLFLGNEQSFDKFMTNMRRHVDISEGTRNQRALKTWNGLELHKTSKHVIIVTQIAKVRAMAREFGAEIAMLESQSKRPAPTPEFSEGDNLSPLDMIDPTTATPAERKTIQRFQEMTGSLMYVATYTRFDIAFATNKASRLMHAASERHIIGAARIIKYLRDNEDLPLIYDGTQSNLNDDPKLFCFVDSDFGGEPLHDKNQGDLGRKSTGACLIQSMNGPIFWKSKLQRKVAQASGEAEFRALSYALKEVVYCIYFLAELGFDVKWVPIFCDASVGVAQAKRDGLSWVEGTKQYEIELSAAYQMCREGMIMPLKIDTDENPADLFTKSDPGKSSAVRQKHIDRISGRASVPFRDWVAQQLDVFKGSSISRHGHISRADLFNQCGLTMSA